MKGKFYIYRMKANGICVAPSRSKSEEATWAFAIKWLRPASITDDVEAEKFVRESGEVIEDNEN